MVAELELSRAEAEISSGQNFGKGWLMEEMEALLKPTKLALSKCEGCNKKGAGLLRCSRCMSAGYCNAECQHGHWQEHKVVCNEVEKNRQK